MSTSIAQEVSCPHCGCSAQTRLWPEIDCKADPDQRERILEESLFVWDCPDCGYEMQLVYPCLYHDAEHHILLLLDPNQKEQMVDKKALSAPNLPQEQKRIVSSIEELKEKILIFEAGLEDAACELAKLAMAQIVANHEGEEPAAGYFSKADPEKNEITFVFVFDGRAEPLYQTTRFDVYRKTSEITQQLQFQGAGSEFLRVDSDMAKMMLEAYQNQ